MESNADINQNRLKDVTLEMASSHEVCIILIGRPGKRQHSQSINSKGILARRTRVCLASGPLQLNSRFMQNVGYLVKKLGLCGDNKGF